MTKHLPYLNALYFGANTYIDNFRTYVLLTLIWLAIWTAFCGAIFLVHSYPHFGNTASFTPNFTELPINLLLLSTSTYKLLIVIVVALIFNLIYQYQLVLLAMAFYKSTSLRLADLFSLHEKEFYLFAGARLLLALKFILGLLALVVPGFFYHDKVFLCRIFSC